MNELEQVKFSNFSTPVLYLEIHSVAAYTIYH